MQKKKEREGLRSVVLKERRAYPTNACQQRNLHLGLRKAHVYDAKLPGGEIPTLQSSPSLILNMWEGFRRWSRKVGSEFTMYSRSIVRKGVGGDLGNLLHTLFRKRVARGATGKTRTCGVNLGFAWTKPGSASSNY